MPVRRTRDWSILGVIDVPAPGRYQILHSNSQGIGARAIAKQDDGRVTMTLGSTGILHTCLPCRCCQSCACYTETKSELCGRCEAFRTWREQARPVLERYLAACAEPDGWFVVTGSNIVHTVGCSALSSVTKAVTERLDDDVCPHDREYFYEHQPHEPVHAETVSRGRRCLVCSPDIALPPRRTGRFTAGGGRDA